MFIYFTGIFFHLLLLYVFEIHPAASEVRDEGPRPLLLLRLLYLQTPHDLQGEMEDNVRGHRRAAVSVGGGTGRMGSRWQWLCPISTTEGGLKMATGPPHINSIQGDALSSRQLDTFLTTSTPPPPPQNPNPTSHRWRCWINHLGTYSVTLKSRVGPIARSRGMRSRWGNIFLKMRQNKIGFKMTGHDLPDAARGRLGARQRRLREACLGDNLQQAHSPHLSSQCEERGVNSC